MASRIIRRAPTPEGTLTREPSSFQVNCLRWLTFTKVSSRETSGRIVAPVGVRFARKRARYFLRLAMTSSLSFKASRRQALPKENPLRSKARRRAELGCPNRRLAVDRFLDSRG